MHPESLQTSLGTPEASASLISSSPLSSSSLLVNCVIPAQTVSQGCGQETMGCGPFWGVGGVVLRMRMMVMVMTMTSYQLLSTEYVPKVVLG